ncbi:protein phosphatase 2C domain-containing protein [Besnoitia besnoiti]|uniref:protein-serine/threonine phosphatase n=1 Tax=Besnoitia besnoiti TaxID=94643 RepID=A0A2A9M7U9_BESBE|nr:protein phosphatase 2C domain-containing protein [Besnoitia besnoiti]PFH34075.1 protein phosphatase 2C domain-containing protein [Besnoitia besnoiti]
MLVGKRTAVGSAPLGAREPQLKRRQTEAGNCVVDYGDYRLWASCYGDKGLRKQMEDEHLLIPSLLPYQPALSPSNDFALFAVFDGHGGRQSAAFVKEALPAELAAQLLILQEEKKGKTVSEGAHDVALDGDYSDGEGAVEGELSDRDMKRIIYGACRKVDARIATEIPACRDGCTAVVALFHGRHVYIAGLGDSVAYLARRRDRTLHSIPLTEVHRHWVIEEKERIARMGGTIENGRVNGSLEVTRSFGDISLKRYGVSCIPTVKKFTLEPALDEFVLMGCDGFWNCWTASEAVALAAELWEKEIRSSKVHSRPGEPQNVCKQLVEHVLIDKKSQDNITVLLIRVARD